MTHPGERLASLGLTLPAPATPSAYAPVVVHGDLVFASGRFRSVDGQLQETGKVGKEISNEAAKEAARQCVLNGLAAVEAEFGDLALIRRVVKRVVFVACAPDFSSQPLVADGASKLIVDLFGTPGLHARSVIGVAVLPSDSPVEVELIVAL